MNSLKTLITILALSWSAVGFSQGIVNINAADADTIAENLKGIGEKKSIAIVNYRNENGMFKTVSDLALVKGISERTLEANKEFIVLTEKK